MPERTPFEIVRLLPTLIPPRTVALAIGNEYAFAPAAIPASLFFSAVVKSFVERPFPLTLSTFVDNPALSAASVAKTAKSTVITFPSVFVNFSVSPSTTALVIQPLYITSSSAVAPVKTIAFLVESNHTEPTPALVGLVAFLKNLIFAILTYI